MSRTICFDRTEEAKRILKNGIKETSVRARSELRTAAWYLVNRTTYSQAQIEKRLRSVSSEYFRGMTDSYIDASIREIIASARDDIYGNQQDTLRTQITIYEKELKEIETIGHDDTERLAFVFLCMAKLVPYERIYECNAELYRLAWRYLYDQTGKKVLGIHNGRRVSGREATRRVNRLCQSGFVQYSVVTNTANRNVPSKATASAMFSVPFVQHDGDVAFVIRNPDRDSLVLYYDRYKGYGEIVTCELCGKPVLRTGRRQKYCGTCADLISHHPEKRDLCNKMQDGFGA